MARSPNVDISTEGLMLNIQIAGRIDEKNNPQWRFKAQAKGNIDIIFWRHGSGHQQPRFFIITKQKFKNELPAVNWKQVEPVKLFEAVYTNYLTTYITFFIFLNFAYNRYLIGGVWEIIGKNSVFIEQN